MEPSAVCNVISMQIAAAPQNLKQLFHQWDSALLFIVSLAFNLLSGGVALSLEQRASLQKYKSFLLKLAAPQTTLKEKQTLVQKQTNAQLAEAIKTLIRIAKCHDRSL